MPYCNDCGRIIVLGTLPDGKKVPLDPKASVYQQIENRVVNGKPEMSVFRNVNAMASHQSTCPKSWVHREHVEYGS